MAFDFSDNREALDVINLINFSDDNVFLTGRAGTGKSTFLRELVKDVHKKFVILAPTGNTALNISGKTIHSFFQFAPIPFLPNDPVNYEYKEEKQLLIKNLDLLIVDEISMVRADIIDAIDRTLRYYKRSNKPFGGVQILFVGDSFQLPPIVTKTEWEVLKQFYSSLFFFDALVFKDCKLLTVELLKVYRQQESRFLNILDGIRLNNFTKEHLDLLNARVTHSFDKSALIMTIATKKAQVEKINMDRLANISSPSKYYEGITTGKFVDKPTLQRLELKVGAQIMMVKNDYHQRWVNGSMGTVVELASDFIKIRLDDAEIVKVERETWSNIEFKFDKSTKQIITSEIGKFIQFPIALCWAMTIHKSQGLTFDKISVDLGDGIWDSGQTYVALSRCRTINGLYLTRPVRANDIKLHSSIIEFSNGFNNENVYKSSHRAKLINKEYLLNAIEVDKLTNDYLKIITNVDAILKLSVDLITTFHLLSLKAYCLFRASKFDIAISAVKELDKYQTLKKAIGPMTYDSIVSILHGVELLQNIETQNRGFQKINMVLSMNMPETLVRLNDLVFDKELLYKEYTL